MTKINTTTTIEKNRERERGKKLMFAIITINNQKESNDNRIIYVIN